MIKCQSVDIHCKFFFNFACLSGIFHNKMLGKETEEVFSDQITLSLVDHESGFFPKMDRKPLKHFGQGGTMIRFVFAKLSLAAMQGGVIELGRQ